MSTHPPETDFQRAAKGESGGAFEIVACDSWCDATSLNAPLQDKTTLRDTQLKNGSRLMVLGTKVDATEAIAGGPKAAAGESGAE